MKQSNEFKIIFPPDNCLMCVPGTYHFSKTRNYAIIVEFYLDEHYFGRRTGRCGSIERLAHLPDITAIKFCGIMEHLTCLCKRFKRK